MRIVELTPAVIVCQSTHEYDVIDVALERLVNIADDDTEVLERISQDDDAPFSQCFDLSLMRSYLFLKNVFLNLAEFFSHLFHFSHLSIIHNSFSSFSLCARLNWRLACQLSSAAYASFIPHHRRHQLNTADLSKPSTLA